MNSLRAICIVLLALALGPPSPAQQPLAPAPVPAVTQSAPRVTSPLQQPAFSDEALASFVDGYLTDAMDRSALPGASLVLVRDGRVILAKGYGFADYKSRRPVEVEQSLFRQASVSKLFTWLLVMQLVEEGRLDLDRDVNNYLDFRIPDVFGKPITMRHLMTHTPGFAERYRGIYEPDATTPLGQQLRGNIPARVYPPGSTMAYTNYGTALAGYIVERLRGRPFETLVQERIFAPVGMVRSSFGRPPPAPLARQLVSGYKPGSREAYRFEVLGGAPAGALSATGGDMGRFLLMLMNGGQGANGRVVSPAGVQRMMEVAHRPVPMEQSGFGLGMIVSEQRGVRTAGHGGNLTTTATDLLMFPQHGFGWHLAFNGPGNENAATKVRANLVRAVIARFIAPQAPIVTATGPSTASDLAGKWLSTRRLHSGPLSAGSALSLVTARAERDGTLRLSNALYPDGSERRWLPAGRDRFREQETGAWLVAKRDGSGKVVRFASPLVYPVAEFDRATGLVASAVSLFWAAFAVLLVTALSGPARWALRRAYGVQPTPHRGAARTSFVAGRTGIWIILLTLAGWAGVMVKVQGDFQSMFGMRAVFVALALASWLSVLAALAVAADAVLAWRDPARGLPRRVGAALVALAAITLAALFISFDLTSFSTDW